jgi:hypothetical protein
MSYLRLVDYGVNSPSMLFELNIYVSGVICYQLLVLAE